MTDILQFPKSKIVRERTPEIEELTKLKEKGLQKFADALSEDLTDNILHDLSQCGINIEDDTFLKDFYFATMIMNACIYRSVGIEHPMHEFIDKNVQVKEKEDT